MLFLIIFGLLFTGLSQQSQAPQLAKGVIIDTVACTADSTQTYALYLPTTYSPDKQWPILYAFDPAGRGRVGVERFAEAAEKYGYIVVSSYNSRNGVNLPELNKIVNAVWNDTHARFAIDARRVYAAGFSGGARVANQLAVSCKGCIAGVIGCGAGFSQGLKPSADLPFASFGTVGIDDFNFREMRPLYRTLAALGLPSRLATFDGPHQWAPKDVILDGVEWMELQAMKTGRRPPDTAFVRDYLSRKLAQLSAMDKPIQLVDRYLLLSSIVVDFHGLSDVSEQERALAKLKDSKELKTALAEEDKEITEENQIANLILAHRNLLGSGETNDEGDLKRQLADLRAKTTPAQDSHGRRVARRALSQVFAEAYETALFQDEPDKRFSSAIVNLKVAIEASPKNSNVDYELARAYMMAGQMKQALTALASAVGKGFADFETLKKDELFAPIRDDAAFQQLLNSPAKQP